MIRVIFAEDHKALIDGVVSFFNYHEEIAIIDTALNGKKLIELVRKYKPDVVVTDIRMPLLDGIEATKIITKEFPKINVVAFSMFDQPKAVNEMIEAGAKGYILKNSGLKIIQDAIKTVALGKEYFDKGLLLSLKREKRLRGNRKIKKGILSRREKEILELIAKGCTSIEISDALFIKKYTVDTHRKNIIRKLGLKSHADLTKAAVEKRYKF